MKLFIKQTTLFLTLAISLASCQIEFNQNDNKTGNKKNSFKIHFGLNDKVVGNKNVITQERAIPEEFTKVEIQEGITVYLTMSSDEKITVEADENLQEVIKTEIKNGTLKIYAQPNIRKAKTRNVYVSIPNFTGIKTSSGARAISENTLISEYLDIKASSGSSIELRISTGNLTSKSSSGSSIKLNGKSEKLNVKASSGSFINAYGLKAKSVVSKVSSGSNIRVTATESLNGKASSGGSIQYKGNPKQINKKTFSGGNISAQ